MESRLSSKKHGSSRFIARCPPRSHQLQVGKFSATLSPVYTTIRSVFFRLLFSFSFTLSFPLVLLPFYHFLLDSDYAINTTGSLSSRRIW